VLAEQEHACVLWKPPQWSVAVSYSCHELAGPAQATQRQARISLHRAPTKSEDGPLLQDWIMQNFGGTFPIALDTSAAHGLIHRLDRETSGPIICAKTYTGFYKAKYSLMTGSMEKEYVCVCHGWFRKDLKMICASLRSIRNGNTLWSAVVTHGGKQAATEVVAVGHLIGPGASKFSIVQLRLHSGRLHQIRAHLSHFGCPLLGDEMYGEVVRPLWCTRIFLHSHRLCVDVGDGPMDTRIALPLDLSTMLQSMQAVASPDKVVLSRWCVGRPPISAGCQQTSPASRCRGSQH